MSIHMTQTSPSAAQFATLRNGAGWGDISETTASQALAHALAVFCTYNGEALIGIVRLVGDGVLNVYIQDVVVEPSFRGRGIGRRMIKAAIDYMAAQYPPDCTVGLMAARDQDCFYTQFGFIPRPSHVYGAGMTASLNTLCSPERQR